jgi:tricorn protease
MRLPSTAALCAAFLCALPGAALLPAQTKLLRFPDLHGDRVVFTYAGDLWTASAGGGMASRLTSHAGLELFAKFSPDGKWIAFTGQYDGDEQVYVIPSTGGVPKQLTYYPARGPLAPRWGYDNQVYGWTPDGSAILFRSLREGWSPGDSRLFTVAASGGLPVQLPMPLSGGGDLSPDGRKVLYSPLARDFRSWKRYQGGWAQDLYIFDIDSKSVEPVAHHPRTDRDPMWIGEKIYFASDRTGTLNLYEWDPQAKKVRAVTEYSDWDVRWPSKANDGRIVFELDGEVQIVSTKPGSKPAKIRIMVPDDGVHSRPSTVNAGGNVENADLSPKGERALFAARGDIFTAPIEKGVPRNLTRSPGAHDKAAEWSPDGRKVAYISDASGEEELYVVPQDGSGPAEQLTTGGKAMRYRPTWSPDSKAIAISDKDGRLQVVHIADKSVIDVADESRGQLLDYVWSPDSAWLAFSMSGSYDGNGAIYLWNAAGKKLTRVTDEFFNSFAPSWDPDGNYLYYVSEREYAPLLSNIEWNFAGSRNRSIYALALRKDVKNPFPPESDEVTIEPEKKPDETKPEEKKAEQKKEIRIDLEGLGERVTRVPIPAHNYGGVIATKGHLLYTRFSNGYYGRPPDTPTALVIYEIKTRKETVLAEDAGSVAISFDGSKVLVRQGSAFNLYDAKPGGKDSKKTVLTSGLMADRVPSQEWVQIFNEVWRRFRDFFYVSNMHGYDWEALRRQYSPMLEYVSHRSDLNYVISEMISELNVGHAYIEGGDLNMPPRPRVALPGARFELDANAGRYRIVEIFKGHNQEPEYRSPLTEVGVNVNVGDYVLAIDGEELTAATNPYRLLRGKADRQVRMTVNSTPDRNGAREVVFQPVASESNLLYLAWVERNRAAVDKMTGGKVGYLHVPNMGADGIREFIKWFYPQIRKEGLVIDVRGNGGGNVSSMLIERLRRELLATGFSRTNDHPNTYPQVVFHGQLVCLLNETSASDGDIFPAMFKQAKLGPLVGKRSWGGVVGITNRGQLMDGGTVFVPEFGFASADGKWIIEGVGVAPDIVVENDPASVLGGKDPQLERGVAEVMARIKANPKKLPQRPPDPVKTKEAASAR